MGLNGLKRAHTGSKMLTNAQTGSDGFTNVQTVVFNWNNTHFTPGEEAVSSLHLLNLQFSYVSILFLCQFYLSVV